MKNNSLKVLVGLLILVLAFTAITNSKSCNSNPIKNETDTSLVVKYEALAKLHENYVSRTDNKLDSLVKAKNQVEAELQYIKTKSSRSSRESVSRYQSTSKVSQSRVITRPPTIRDDSLRFTITGSPWQQPNIKGSVDSLVYYRQISTDAIDYINNYTVPLPYFTSYLDEWAEISYTVDKDTVQNSLKLTEDWQITFKNDIYISHEVRKKGIWPFRKRKYYIRVEQTNPNAEHTVQGYIIQ